MHSKNYTPGDPVTRLVPLPEARQMLGNISRVGLYRILARNQIAARKIGRRLLLDADSIQRFIEEAPVAKFTPPAK